MSPEASFVELTFNQQLNIFLQYAKEDKWVEFDEKVPDVCNNPEWLSWTLVALPLDERSDARDLAISILEKTTGDLTDEQKNVLNITMTSDTETHLKRKASIALFVHNDRNEQVMKRITEAKNDPELESQVIELLGSSQQKGKKKKYDRYN